jgi:hypothetical protein
MTMMLRGLLRERPIGMQTRKRSALEAFSNAVVSYLIAVVANYYILPLFGYLVTTAHSFAIGGMFTGISVIRSYLIRRLFSKGDREIKT